MNVLTAITTVGLPFYDRNKPMEGTKSARESFRKLLIGMCDDKDILSYRGGFMADKITADPYFKSAPGWSTLSFGQQPEILMAPAQIVPKMVSAASCVPFFDGTKVYIVEPDGRQVETTADAVVARDIQVGPVPNLFTPSAASSASVTTSVDFTPLIQKNTALEASKMALEAQVSVQVNTSS